MVWLECHSGKKLAFKSSNPSQNFWPVPVPHFYQTPHLLNSWTYVVRHRDYRLRTSCAVWPPCPPPLLHSHPLPSYSFANSGKGKSNFPLILADPSALDPISIWLLREPYSASYLLFPRSLQSLIPFRLIFYFPPHFQMSFSTFVPSVNAIHPHSPGPKPNG